MPIIKISDRYRRQWFWFFVFLISFIVLIIGLYIRMISVRSAALEAEKEERLQPVRTQPINITEVWKTATFLARIEGSQTIDISADVGGWVVERNVVRGQKVEKDQVLIVLEDARKTLKLKESEARVKSAKADLKELRRKLAQTKTLLDKGIAAKDTLASFSNQVQVRLLKCML
ncbi:biotin/lipoyl-binding protein [Desulfobacterota bacterium AH_259_B03_O07]|nr:biotin/lipoyl-binding protein [Desulfobacterota bacterium AH_259_B03_O07]